MPAVSDDFRPGMSDYDPVTKRLYRDRWAKRETTFRPSLHLDHDKIVCRTNENPSANATAAEIATLIAALDAHYRELGDRLKALKRTHPLARMPGESEKAYRKRVPQWETFTSEQALVLVWLASNRSSVRAAITALRKGERPGHAFFHSPHTEAGRALFEPFEQRWWAVYRAALAVEEQRVRAIVEATPIDDAAWEKYQLRCDWSDARKEVDAAWSVECAANGGRPPPHLSASDIHDILNERARPRAAEITRVRHAAAAQIKTEPDFAA